MDRATAKEELKTREPDFLEPAKRKVNGHTTYICPSCGNGSGSNGDGIALISLKREQEDHKRLTEAYREYQNNIRRSGSLRTEILKGVRAGESTQLLLLKAVECISCMTGDKLFYSQIDGDLKAIYGEAFLEEIPLEWELEPDARQRVQSAIKAHEERIRSLKGLLEKSVNTDRARAELRQAI